VTTNYLYDGSNPVLVGNDMMLQGLGLDDHFARINSSGATGFLTDALGSTLGLTDSSGAVTASYSYGPYGNVTRTGSDDTPFQYTGRENDGAANLYYYRARYYNPTFESFISADPLGLGGGLSGYGYADGNPISNTDPTGLSCTSAGGTTTCSYPGGPTFKLPTPPGFPDEINSMNRPLYHKYDVQRPLRCANPRDVMQALIDNPTPGSRGFPRRVRLS
jgi:RHS repeat-associated protein